MTINTSTGTLGATRVGSKGYRREPGEHVRHLCVKSFSRPREHDAEIVALRKQGVSERDIAARLGCHRNTVVNAMKRAGIAREYRAKPAKGLGRRKDVTLMEALDTYDGLYLERADLPDGRDGYLVTIQDKTPGMACKTIAAAIRSAIAAMAAKGGV